MTQLKIDFHVVSCWLLLGISRQVQSLYFINSWKWFLEDTHPVKTRIQKCQFRLILKGVQCSITTFNLPIGLGTARTWLQSKNRLFRDHTTGWVGWDNYQSTCVMSHGKTADNKHIEIGINRPPHFNVPVNRNILMAYP